MKARWGWRRLAVFLLPILLYGATIYGVSLSSSIEAQWKVLHFLPYLTFVVAMYAACKPCDQRNG